MAWVYLIFAGLIEVFWAVCMKLSEGFTVFKFSAMTVAGLIASFLLLSQATKMLPIGTAYAIWTGIGALGAVIIGIIMFNEPASPVRLFFVLLLLVGIIGLKLTSH